MAEAEKIYKLAEKSPSDVLKEYNDYFKKFEPINVKLLGVRMQKEEVFYNLTKKYFNIHSPNIENESFNKLAALFNKEL